MLGFLLKEGGVVDKVASEEIRSPYITVQVHSALLVRGDSSLYTYSVFPPFCTPCRISFLHTV